MAGKFKGKVGSAQVFGTGQYFPPDFKGTVEVVSFIYKEDSHNSGPLFIAELKILEGNVGELCWQSSNGPTESKLQIGDVGSYCIMQKHKDTCWSNCKKFIAAVVGVDPNDESIPDDTWDLGLEAATQEDPAADLTVAFPNDVELSGVNPFAGAEVGLVTTATKTKAKTDFTIHTFSHIE